MKYLIKIIIALIIFIIVLDRFSLYLNKEKFKKEEKNYYLEKILDVARNNGMKIIQLDNVFYIVNEKTNKFMRLELVERNGKLVLRFIDLRDSNVSKSHAKGVGNKWKNHILLEKDNIPQIKTIKVTQYMNDDDIIKKMKTELSAPYVIKLIRGMKGEDIYLNLNTSNEIRKVLKKIKSKTDKRRILIQEQSNLKNEYRVFIMGNKIVSIFEKQISNVIGNGKSTLKKLVEDINNRNENLERRYDIKLPKLLIDSSIRLNEKRIPKNGEKVFLSNKKNAYYGSLPKKIDIGTVHDDNIKLFLKVADIFEKNYNQRLIGIDFMIDDITTSYKNNSSAVLEINAMPGFKYIFSAHPKDVSSITQKEIIKEEINVNTRILEVIKHIQTLSKSNINPKHKIVLNKKLNKIKETFNVIKNDEPVNLYWTGGFDSTFLLCHYLIDLKRIVRPIYITAHIDNKKGDDYYRRNRKQEVSAINRILWLLKKKFPEVDKRILPVKLVEDIEIPNEYLVAFNKLNLFDRAINQYVYLAYYAYSEQIPIMIGTVGIIGEGTGKDLPSDRWGIYLRQHLTKNPKNEYLAKDTPVLKYLRFPLAYLSKRKIYDIAKHGNYHTILKETWSCWFPLENGTPCEDCPMCQERIITHPNKYFAV